MSNGKAADGPLIESERLVLRPYRPSDHEALHRIFSDPEMFAYSHRGPMTTEESWSLLLRQIGHWSAFGFGIFGVREKHSGELVGEAGPSDFRRGLGSAFDPFPEMTWSISPGAQGRGYAREAAAAVLDWLRTSADPARTVCLIHEDNEPSLRVAASLGYRSFASLAYRGYAAKLLERG